MALKDQPLNAASRARLMDLIGEIREFAPRLAAARKSEGAGEPNESELDSARKCLERLATATKLKVEAQRDIAKALGMEPAALVKSLLAPKLKAPPAPSAARPGSADQKSLRRYLDWLIADCGTIRLTAINKSAVKPGSKPLDLASVYVGLHLDLRIPEKTSLAKHLVSPQCDVAGNLQAQAKVRRDAAEERQTRPVPALEALAHHSRWVLLGPPGSGKTTFSAHVALSLAEALQKKRGALKRLGRWWTFGPLLPIRVVLRHFAASLPPGADRGRAVHLWDFIRQDLIKSGLPPAAAEIPRQLAETTGALFLFDGLDETRDEHLRLRVLESVAEFMRTAGSQCRFLLTARPYAWDAGEGKQPATTASQGTARKPSAAELTGLDHAYRLAEFDDDQVQAFIQGWYGAVRAAKWPVSDLEGKAEELKQAVRREDMVRLARNPLLLTLMATLHSNVTRLPDDRADLYDEAVKLLMESWNESVGAKQGLLDEVKIPGLTLGHLRTVIEELAFNAHSAHAGMDGVADIAEGTLLSRLRPLLCNDIAKAEIALHYIEERAGLLLGQGEKGAQRQYTFPHRTFQEFLAACHLAEQNDFSGTAGRLARGNPSHWREVLVLAARRAKASRGVPVAHELIHLCALTERRTTHEVSDSDWRAALVAAEMLLEIGLASLTGNENHELARSRIAGWLAGLLEAGALPVLERAHAGRVLGRLGDPRKGVGLDGRGLPEMNWIEIPAGEFTMGGDGMYDGKPRIQFLIKQPYQISRYPVTVAQFGAFVQAGGYGKKEYWSEVGWKWRQSEKIEGPEDHGADFQLPNHPQVGVSWHEAMAFCAWLCERTGKSIRLPTEPEWERAARHIDGRDYPWGNSEAGLAERCNMGGTGIGKTSAVGLFPGGAAECGALDMAGNVWEWCGTPWVSNYKNYEQDVIAKENGQASRVVRGASWRDGGPAALRCACRYHLAPDYRSNYFGFRCVVAGVCAG